MTEQRRRRTVKLPPPVEVDRSAVDEFMDALGCDAEARKRVTSVRINNHRVEVDTRPRPDIKLTVTHIIVWPEDDQ